MPLFEIASATPRNDNPLFVVGAWWNPPIPPPVQTTLTLAPSVTLRSVESLAAD